MRNRKELDDKIKKNKPELDSKKRKKLQNQTKRKGRTGNYQKTTYEEHEQEEGRR